MSKGKKCFYPSRFLRIWKPNFSINFFNAVAHRIVNQVKRSSNSGKCILNPRSLLLFVFLFIFLGRSIAAGPEPPLRDLYMKLLVENVRRTVEKQSDDGGSPAIPVNLAAYLYKTDHPLNPYYGDPRLLDLAIRGGDQLVEHESSNIIWPINYWTLLPWIEALDLIKDSLSREQRVAWTSRIEHWVESYADYVKRSQGKREYTAVQLGSGTNHYSHYLVTVLWAGQALGHPEWVKLAKEEYKNLLRTQHPDGFWSEHHGPVNLYNRATTHGVGLYYALTGDPEALEVLRRAKDFIINFTYPDGSAVSVIDERNRYYPQIDFPWGLVGLSHFPDGRRYNRLMTQKTIERLENSKTGQKNGKSLFDYNLSSSDLSQILENLKYSATGDESPAPQEVDRYEARLMDGAVLMRRGSWVICVSGIISPPWEGNRFFLDRYTYLEVWHRKTGLLIGGGNTKRQPQIAGLLMEPSHAGLDFWPQESRITTLGDTILLELSFEKFCARKKVAIIDDQTLKIKVDFTETTPPILWPNRYECNLQLQLKAGQSLTAVSQEKITLSSQLVHLLEEQVGTSLETEFWCLEVPNGRTSLRFPFIPFNNYNIDGIGDPGSAVAILSSFTNEPSISLEYLLKIK